MKKSIKRTFVAILILCLSVVSLAPVSAVAEGNEIMPLFNNVNNAIAKYSLQGTTQGRHLTGGVPPVRFSM